MSGLHFRSGCRALHEALRILFAVAPTSDGELPVLRNILFKTDKKGKLRATAFDLSVGAHADLDCVEVLNPGKAMISSYALEESLKELTGESLEFLFEDNYHCTMTTDNSKFVIPCQTPEDYPRVPRVKDTQSIELPGKILKRMIHGTHYAAHKDRGKWAINGVLVDVRPDSIRLVATDTKRLALCQWDVETGMTMKAIIPTKAMEIFSKSIDVASKASIEVAKNMVRLSTSRTTLFARSVIGEFPPYEKVIPRTPPRKLRFIRGTVVGGLRQSLMLGKGKQEVQVGLALTNNQLRIYRRSLESGNSDVTLDVKYADDDMILGCNAAFLLEAIRMLEKPKTRILFTDSEKPMLMRERNEDGLKMTHLVMPMKIVPD